VGLWISGILAAVDVVGEKPLAGVRSLISICDVSCWLSISSKSLFLNDYALEQVRPPLPFPLLFPSFVPSTLLC
jgi:hypothetical protein